MHALNSSTDIIAKHKESDSSSNAHRIKEQKKKCSYRQPSLMFLVEVKVEVTEDFYSTWRFISLFEGYNQPSLIY